MMAATTKPISVANLALDVQNPRLEEGQENPRDALTAMIEAQGDKLVALAADIVADGLNPSELMIVMPDDKTDNRFVVLEGNRRIAALKLLDQPSLGEGLLKQRALRRLSDLHRVFLDSPIRTVTCTVVAKREDADHWIALRHRGQQAGAGLVPWGAVESARFAARFGRTDPALKALEIVAQRGELDDDTRSKLGDVPITNLQRLLSDRYVRDKLGIDKEKGELLTSYPDAEVLKGLTRVVRDLANDTIIVSDIYRANQRKAYVDGFKKSELPDPNTKLSSQRAFGTDGGVTVPIAAKRKGKPSKPSTLTRRTLVPRSARLAIADRRISNIYGELKRLNIEKFSNAGAVLLRVFIELGVDDYIGRNSLMDSKQLTNSFLKDKLRTACNHLEQTAVMTKKELVPIRRAVNEQHLLASSVKTMHQYVHNKHYSPSPAELKIAWDNFELFMQKVLV